MLGEPSEKWPTPLDDTVSVLLPLWCTLLVIGAFPAPMLTGMAFEGGNTFGAYYSVTIVWIYPPLLAIAYFYRRKKPALAWLPAIPVALMLLSLFTNWP